MDKNTSFIHELMNKIIMRAAMTTKDKMINIISMAYPKTNITNSKRKKSRITILVQMSSKKKVQTLTTVLLFQRRQSCLLDKTLTKK